MAENGATFCAKESGRSPPNRSIKNMISDMDGAVPQGFPAYGTIRPASSRITRLHQRFTTFISCVAITNISDAFTNCSSRVCAKSPLPCPRPRSPAATTSAAYDKGVVSLIEVLQADESLLNVLDAQVQATTESTRSAVATFRAVGGGWSPEQPPMVVSRS